MFSAPRPSETRLSAHPFSGHAKVAYLRGVDAEVYTDWESVYRDNVERLYRLIYSRVRNRPDAEDRNEAARTLDVTVSHAKVLQHRRLRMAAKVALELEH
jgi:hypothetical protein